MAVDVQRGKAKVVRLVPSSPMASPHASLIDRAGEVKASGLVCTPSTVDVVAISVGGATRTLFQVTTTAGCYPGITIRVTFLDGVSAVTTVAKVDGTVNGWLTVTDPLPAVPSDDVAVHSLDVLVTIPDTATDELYLGYVLELSDLDGVDSVQEVVNVVSYVYAGPCAARDVRALLARGYAGESLSDETLHQRIADEVNRQIRGRLLASAAYASSYWDPDALALVKSPMLRLVLAEQYGMREAGSSRDDYLSSLRLEVRDRVGDVVRSAQVYDHDNDGVVKDEDTKKAFLVDLVL